MLFQLIKFIELESRLFTRLQHFTFKIFIFFLVIARRISFFLFFWMTWLSLSKQQLQLQSHIQCLTDTLHIKYLETASPNDLGVFSYPISDDQNMNSFVYRIILEEFFCSLMILYHRILGQKSFNHICLPD